MVGSRVAVKTARPLCRRVDSRPGVVAVAPCPADSPSAYSRTVGGDRVRADQRHDDIVYPATIPFVVLHLSCLAAFWTGVTGTAIALGIVLYLVRLFAVT